MSARNKNRKTRRQDRRPKQLGIENVEARNLMAADVVAGFEPVDTAPTEALAADQARAAQVAEGQASKATISNGFLSFALPDLRGRGIDVWEHAYSIGSSGQDGGVDTDDGGTRIGSSGQDGLLSTETAQRRIGPSGLDGVDTYFSNLGDQDHHASSVPDEYNGILRWDNLMEYFDVLDQLEEKAREMDFDFTGGTDFDESLARARQDNGLMDQELLTLHDFERVMDSVIEDITSNSDASSSSDSDDKHHFEDRIAEALQEMKERMVVRWQNVDGPGGVVHDPFNVAADEPRHEF